MLCLVYGKFIQVWRQKEAALYNSQLTKLLLANASHEGRHPSSFPKIIQLTAAVRTPLNAIINYLEIALESPLDPETRDNLMRSHSASKSLIYVINDLLDLTRIEEGQDLLMDGVFDLSNTVHEAISLFKSDAERKDISLVVVEYPGLPRLVKGDQSRLRQAISNIVGNAVKNTNMGGVKVEVWAPEALDDRCQVEIVIQDTGVGISPKRLDMLFQEFEQVQTAEEGEDPPRLGQTFDGHSKIPGQKMLGLGLAIVARTIRNVNGQLRLRSEEGKGTQFTIVIPLKLPSENERAESGFQSSTPMELSPHPQSMIPQDSTESPTADLSPQNPPSPRIAMEGNCSSISTKGLETRSNEHSEMDGIRTTTSSGESPRIPRPTTSKPSLLSRSGAMNPKNASPPSPTVINLQLGREVVEVSTVFPGAPVQAKYPLNPRHEALPGNPTIQSYGKHLGHKEPAKNRPANFKVLVAEDDPINSKIIKKRMERLGHDVCLTVNGAECMNLFMKNSEEYDIVLMDMQVGIPLGPH